MNFIYCNGATGHDPILEFQADQVSFLDNRDSQFNGLVDAINYNGYRDSLVKSLCEANKHNEVYLSTPFACNNDWQSKFYGNYKYFIRVIKLIEAGVVFRLSHIDHDWLCAVKEYANKNHLEVQIPWWTLAIAKIKLFHNSLKYALQLVITFVSLINLCKPASRKITPKLKDAAFFLFSTWNNNSLSKPNSDPFLGSLMERLSEKIGRGATFCHLSQNDNWARSHLSKLESHNGFYFSYFDVLRFKHCFKVISKLVSFSLNIPNDFASLTRPLNEEMKKTICVQSMHALLIKAVAIEIMNNNNSSPLIHMFEGNCWERGVVFAREKLHAPNKIIGYQHTSFPLSFRKLVYQKGLSPDAIFTSGEVPARILCKHFHYPNDKVIPGFSLRPGQIIEIDENKCKKTFPTKLERVLILLQGSPSDQLLLDKVLSFFCDEEIPILSIRPHPLQDVKELTISDRFSFSGENSLFEDVAKVDMIFHSGTTAALSVASSGTPCVYVNLHKKQDNPFFMNVDNLLMPEVNNAESFISVMNKLVECSSLFSSSIANIRKFSEDYFTCYSNELFERFLKIL